ncbi:MAG: hypothetical protein GTO24_19875 [candidate division Zixibacteria bacterium]|nr:hypothetical protein [candidate division Zixibacteria bacterium]
MVIASKEPIKAETQSMIEPASPYIDRLAKSLQKQKAKGKLAGAHVIILTKGREPNDTGQSNP